MILVRRKFKAWLIGAGLTMAAVITVAGLLGALLARSAPSWWRQYRPTAELREHATSFENAAVSTLYRSRPTDPEWEHTADSGPWRSVNWSIYIRDEDASAWLSTRLPEWVDGQADLAGWPDALHQPQVHFAEDVVRLGVLLRREDGDRIVTASFRPHIDESGSLWLHADWIHIGRLPIPASLLLSRAGSRMDSYLPETVADDPYSSSFLDVLRGRIPLADKPELRLEDGRVVRLLAIRVFDGRIEIDCRTESVDALAKQ